MWKKSSHATNDTCALAIGACLSCVSVESGWVQNIVMLPMMLTLLLIETVCSNGGTEGLFAQTLSPRLSLEGRGQDLSMTPFNRPLQDTLLDKEGHACIAKPDLACTLKGQDTPSWKEIMHAHARAVIRHLPLGICSPTRGWSWKISGCCMPLLIASLCKYQDKSII